MGSSIHIEAVKTGSFMHNDRSMKVSYLIDDSAKNYCSVSAEEALKNFNHFKEIATQKYQENTKQKLQAKTIFLKEAIVNLEAHHTEKNLEPIIEKLENYGFKVLQVAIHRDEGFRNKETNKNQYNYHAHITMFNLDLETGKSVKFGKNYRTELSKLQTFVANTLKMERGKISDKTHAEELEREYNPHQTRRLGTHQYKRFMAEKEEVKKEYQYNFREMQQRITALQELDAEQKKQLHKLNTEINKIKANDSLKSEKIEELEAKIKEQNAEYQQAVEFVGKHADIEISKSFWIDFKNKMQNMAHKESETALKLQEKQNTINYLDEEIDELCELTEAPSGFRDTYKNIFDWAKFKINQLKTTIKTLLQENSDLKRENEKLKKQIAAAPREETTDEVLERCLREAEKLNIQPLTQEERDILNSLARQGDEIERESSRGFRLN